MSAPALGHYLIGLFIKAMMKEVVSLDAELEVGGIGQELPVLHHTGWANLKVFKEMLKALLLRETSCNKG